MPSSASETIPYLVEFTRKNRPQLKTVLDVGVGFGKDGFLLREYYDVKEWHNYRPETWQLKITGVDIYNGYISELQRMIYNKIIIGDIIGVLPRLGTFDLAVLGDVIEHLSKEEGYHLLDSLFEHVEDIVITTPLGFQEHHGRDENVHEEHKSGWVLDDFKKYHILDSAQISRIRKKEEVLIIYLRK